MVTSNGTMTVSGVGLVTHTGSDFEEPFSIDALYTGPPIHILMLVGNLVEEGALSNVTQKA